MPERGTLFLVVGPSGVGKDSLIDIARARLADDTKFHFPTRAITRPAEAGGEAHRALTEGAFEAESQDGAFALEWRAHGLRYGVPASIEEALAAGRSVVVNVSRGILDDARSRYEKLRVLSIVTNADALTERLRNRGRETEEEIAGRVARATAYDVSGSDVLTIDNSTDLSAAEAAFVAALKTS